MTRPSAASALALAACVFVFGCNRTAPSTDEAAATPAATEEAPAPPPSAPEPPPPPPIPVATELSLETVGSAMLSRPADDPMAAVIEVSGTALSPGWTRARLAEEPADPDNPSVRTYRLLATSPDNPIETRSSTSMSVELRVEALPAEVKTIRILAERNEIAIPVTR